METLHGKYYIVRSFFNAIHAVLYHCISEDQTFRESLTSFILFTKLLNRALQSLPIRTCLSSKIVLLLCCNQSSNVSRAFLGFSAAGPPEVKQKIIEDRRRYMPILERIDTFSFGLPWPVGNCAEAETFAHLNGIRCGPSILMAVSLTLDLKELTSHGPCPQCRTLLREVRLPHLVTLDLAPKAGQLRNH